MKGRILLADDDAAMRTVISYALRKAGYEVEVTKDGLAAWQALNKCESIYDVLITDQEMPYLSGLDLVKRIREAGWTLPILMISGCLSAKVESLHLNYGIDATLRKPFDAERLIQKTEVLMNRAAVLA